MCTNIDVLNYLVPTTDTENRAKLVTTIWYQGNIMKDGNDYSTTSLVNTNSYNGTMGLIRVGEMLSGQSETILNPIVSNTRTANSNNFTNTQYYWTVTPYNPSRALCVRIHGNASFYNVPDAYGVRPVINVNSTTIISGGLGTPMSPYQI